jgi:ABC-type branched-subunit amino acid transport system permease subunit
VLAALLWRCCWALAFAPFLFPGVKALNVAAKVLVFIVLVASFDLLLGYTGIVSFAHTMFFGIGAYGIAIASTRWGRPGKRWQSGWARRWRCRSCWRWRSACSRCGCGRSSSR